MKYIETEVQNREIQVYNGSGDLDFGAVKINIPGDNFY
jgi:hypothetical protein